jgi:predicted nuclease of restriction endonuclease-like (RecB) superfamily
MADLVPTPELIGELRELIEASRLRAASVVNSELVLLYWRVGRRLRVELLNEERAAYGEQIVTTLSARLVSDYGRGFGRRNLYRMIRFAELFSDEGIVTTLSAQLTWSHFVELLLVEDGLARDFYVEMCRLERWSVRTLRARIDGMLFERTALSKKPETLIREELDALRREDRLTPDLVFRDPYVLDFLGLKDTWSERDLEAAILRELESFILELGTDFCFVARQKRIVLDGEDHFLDLLFYHRGLRRLIAVELKLGRFRAADKGQVELYLRWLDRHERRAGEEAPLGLILCADKGQQLIELLELEASGIHVAEYLTELPPRELIERKLLDAIRVARESHGSRLIEAGKGEESE